MQASWTNQDVGKNISGFVVAYKTMEPLITQRFCKPRLGNRKAIEPNKVFSLDTTSHPRLLLASVVLDCIRLGLALSCCTQEVAEASILSY